MERLANQQYKTMEKTTYSQSIRFLRKRVQWQPFNLFFRTNKKKNKPTRRSRRRRRLGDDVALTENLRNTILTFPSSIVHSLLDDASKPPMLLDKSALYVTLSTYCKPKGPRVIELSQLKRTNSNSYSFASTSKGLRFATTTILLSWVECLTISIPKNPLKRREKKIPSVILVHL
ncbi:uncharacterized protein ACNLHF_013542 isoform 2-T12 [Anomaloglossus baeobatrachus]|uniref:uncharacterized protein LOC142296792 isoform X2 n=1 Tax=Anomaloglossus baeobatrachus TaxID=238106 RepID=UPI003F50CC94